MYRRSLIQAEKNPLGVTVLVLDSFFLFLAAVALAIRITSRKIQGLQLCLNDYAALIAWVLSITRFLSFLAKNEKPCAAGLVVTAILGKYHSPEVQSGSDSEKLCWPDADSTRPTLTQPIYRGY